MDITAAQCRAARALLNLKQDALAELSRVSRRTIAYFENGERMAVPATVEALRRALEAQGVIFIAENGDGPGVRIRKGA
ncbi:helix-turn-helix transcriptional regulator [Asticcacaulis sp.]|uniref:helix-turn-helix transcriptional regulator n=1 Tax=Asticcacaulis sp. TaxID=1872648 RepID=UPI002C2B3CC7|nr:helix-turn-helix transcriptional regulator [Asticcacaulis sp.]HTM79786.1 helix-turn-helix transcriptional regulator [Asticcacaulis sp.]